MYGCAEASVSAAQRSPVPSLGAKLGAIRGGLPRTAVDAGGIEVLLLRQVWILMDVRGRRLEIYGSGGWVFESPWARCRNPL